MKHVTKIFFKLLQTHVGRTQTILLSNIFESNFVIRSYWSLLSPKCGLKLQYNRIKWMIIIRIPRIESNKWQEIYGCI